MLNTRKPLVLTPNPKPFESLSSYLWRLTESNGYPSVAWTLMDIPGLPGRELDLVHDLDALAELGVLTRKDPDVLGQMTMLRFSRDGLLPASMRPERHRTEGYMVQPILGRYTRRVCPKCLAEANYLRIFWGLTPVLLCAQHKSILVDRCVCGKPLRFPQVLHGLCGCGQLVKDLPAISVSEDRLALAFADAVEHYLGVGLSQKPKLGYASDLDPTRFFLLIEFLRRWICTFETEAFQLVTGRSRPDTLNRRPTAQVQLPLETDARVHMVAFEVLAQWPERFHELLDLDRQYSHPMGPWKTGVQHDFGHFRRGLRHLREDWFPSVYDSFADYLLNHWDGGHPSLVRLVARRTVDKSQSPLITQQEAAVFLQVHVKVLRQLLAEGLLTTIHLKRGKRKGGLVKRESCDRLMNRLRALCEPRDNVFAPSGDPSDNLKELESWRPLPEAAVLTGVSLARVISAIGSEGLGLRQGLGKGLDQFLVCPATLLDLRVRWRREEWGLTAKQAAAHIGMPISLLERAAQSGLIGFIRGPGRSTLAGMYFRLDELAQFRSVYIDRRGTERFLDVRESTLYWWVEKGYVHPVLRPTEKLQGWLFAVCDLERFKTGLVMPKEVADILGTDLETVNQLVRERKLKAIIGTSQQGEKLCFLLRKDIEGLVGADRR